MKTCFAHFWSPLLAVLSFMLPRITAHAQGTITFDWHPNWVGTNYVESGMAFQLVVPQGSTLDYMGIVPPFTYQGVPQNSTPFMWWFRQNNPYNYVSLSLTNGSLFGLRSVQLADPIAPSLSPVSISFVGYLFGGGTVTNTFTTPGNGATTFATYTFNSDFSPTLTRVDILAPRWAMDNLVFVIPEPGVGSLMASGLLTFAGRQLHRRRRL
jgi:hypothetical protein